ncbi:Mut7-C RNAse domain-containing protein [Flaviaesturariibacter amylovorans]|uniref:Mut7-C RNAse domain-containing protein n=1 Tax=Flaviaesturariibacter amylovorans TaxID=1084520 RepID=A0ABP8GAL3_9BACT
MDAPLHTARVCFEGRLADFRPGPLTPEGHYRFSGHPTIKDAIEALGVPHVEAGTLLVNGTGARFSDPLQPGHELQVFPDDAPLPAPRFVLDVHLGSLARALRLLGFDCLYENDYSDPQIAAIAAAEQRAVLTRDIGLLKHGKVRWGYWLRSQHSEEQLAEVIGRYRLQDAIAPFRRCLSCNGAIAAVAEADVRALIPPRVLGFQKEYFQCAHCGKVYWKGTHYQRMKAFIERVSK